MSQQQKPSEPDTCQIQLTDETHDDGQVQGTCITCGRAVTLNLHTGWLVGSCGPKFIQNCPSPADYNRRWFQAPAPTATEPSKPPAPAAPADPRRLLREMRLARWIAAHPIVPEWLANEQYHWELGRRARWMRHVLKMGPQEVAEILGYSVGHIANLIGRSNAPSPLEKYLADDGDVRAIAALVQTARTVSSILEL